MDTLGPVGTRDDEDERERWLIRWSLPLTSLTPTLLADVERRLGIGDKGQPQSASTASRFRKISRSCIRRAVDLDQLSSDPWPPTPKGRSTRKARRQRKAVDIRRLPDPATMGAILDAIPSHQPGSLIYQAMSAVSYYAGLRPSEVVMLRPRAVHLAGPGEWGAIDVLDADDGYDEPADPKTGTRTVPIPPVLADRLGQYVAERKTAPDALIFRTRNDLRPTASNWNRALKCAAANVGHGRLSPYDCRHACATTWLKAGVPLGEAALRLGHSVETLVSYYVGAL